MDATKKSWKGLSGRARHDSVSTAALKFGAHPPFYILKSDGPESENPDHGT